MRRTPTVVPTTARVHEPQPAPSPAIHQQIAASAHQRQVAREMLEESRRLSDLTRQLLTHQRRDTATDHDA